MNLRVGLQIGKKVRLSDTFRLEFYGSGGWEHIKTKHVFLQNPTYSSEQGLAFPKFNLRSILFPDSGINERREGARDRGYFLVGIKLTYVLRQVMQSN